MNPVEYTVLFHMDRDISFFNYTVLKYMHIYITRHSFKSLV